MRDMGVAARNAAEEMECSCQSRSAPRERRFADQHLMEIKVKHHESPAEPQRFHCDSISIGG